MQPSHLKKDLDTYILTRQEHLIMKVIWEWGSVSAKDVRRVLSKEKEVAYTTVLTFLRILQQKGILERRRVGRADYYRPNLTKRQAIRNQVKDLLVNYFDGDPRRLIENIRKNNYETI